MGEGNVTMQNAAKDNARRARVSAYLDEIGLSSDRAYHGLLPAILLAAEQPKLSFSDICKAVDPGRSVRCTAMMMQHAIGVAWVNADDRNSVLAEQRPSAEQFIRQLAGWLCSTEQK